MKIGVISDTHGDLKAWSKIQETIFHDCKHIIHAGDILYHGPRNPIVEGYNSSELAKEINKLNIPIHIARGNCDADVDQMVIEKPIMAPGSPSLPKGTAIPTVAKIEGNLIKIINVENGKVLKELSLM